MRGMKKINRFDFITTKSSKKQLQKQIDCAHDTSIEEKFKHMHALSQQGYKFMYMFDLNDLNYRFIMYNPNLGYEMDNTRVEYRFNYEDIRKYFRYPKDSTEKFNKIENNIREANEEMFSFFKDLILGIPTNE